MVVGGYSPTLPNGLLADVELISPSKGNACTKRVRPLPGVWYDVGTHLEKESASLGMTGTTRFQDTSNLTDPFVLSEPQNPSFDVSKQHKNISGY